MSLKSKEQLHQDLKHCRALIIRCEEQISAAEDAVEQEGTGWTHSTDELIKSPAQEELARLREEESRILEQLKAFEPFG